METLVVAELLLLALPLVAEPPVVLLDTSALPLSAVWQFEFVTETSLSLLTFVLLDQLAVIPLSGPWVDTLESAKLMGAEAVKTVAAKPIAVADLTICFNIRFSSHRCYVLHPKTFFSKEVMMILNQGNN
jgi:hypothetical protein